IKVMDLDFWTKDIKIILSKARFKKVNTAPTSQVKGLCIAQATPMHQEAQRGTLDCVVSDAARRQCPDGPSIQSQFD
ncbi:hypothetical protein HAX54_037368, partial [Datura stramonium]|nr:hypothetical protein [Datura stramonium]